MVVFTEKHLGAHNPPRIMGWCDATLDIEPTSEIDIRTRASFASLAVGRRPACSAIFLASGNV